MLTTKEYFKVAKERLASVKEAQRENILAAAKMMGDCMENDGVVQLFGLNHGRAFSMELGYRAGGLMPFHQFNVVDLVMRGVIKEDEFQQPDFDDNTEMAHKLWDMYNVMPTDMFILISFAGNEGIMIETALKAKAAGHKIIAVVSQKQAQQAVSRHPSGKKLSDLADLVIDNGADECDALLDVDGTHKMTQIATITGNVIAQMITAETYHYLTSMGKDCPILLSANVKGADEHNRAMSDKYLGRWDS
ncbi:MAG: sugar isomerase domain-containing protein [Erysipelotrichaceae bacterium]|nr:sugar isomerase domain-containing protein [Erysipelotrichaceae bacterium]MCI9312970.1 sugar isomerase domain-containing protein [Erysipelotrichaceae bacterium]